MRIHVVRPEDNWVLQKIGDSLLQSRGAFESASADPRRDVDVNFFCNYALFHPTDTYDVGWFTHMPADADDEGWRQKLFLDVASKIDFCVAQSNLTASHLPKVKTAVWHGLPVVTAPREKLVIGVCAIESRRKRFDRIKALSNLERVEVRLSGGSLSESELAAFFRSIDYLLVTSDTEGGPIPVLEALASGVPVLAPNVGFCWEYPVVKYADSEDLIRVVKKLRPASDPRKQAAQRLEAILVEADGREKTDAFVLAGQSYSYMYHEHNCGFPPSRRTERSVELPIADQWLQRHPAAIEIGAVTPYYWPHRVSQVVDASDLHACVSRRESLFEISLEGRDVLSISTLEHIGERRYGLKERRSPIEAIEKIVSESSRFLITWPVGASAALDRWALEYTDDRRASGRHNLPKSLEVRFLVRRADESWEECNADEAQIPYGNQEAPWANAIAIVKDA